MCVCVCVYSRAVATGPLGGGDAATQGNCFVLLMNDDECEQVLCVSVCGCRSQVFKPGCCYKWASLQFFFNRASGQEPLS